MTLWDIILIVCVATLVVCPPKWDPAIWLKDRNEKK